MPVEQNPGEPSQDDLAAPSGQTVNGESANLTTEDGEDGPFKNQNMLLTNGDDLLSVSVFITDDNEPANPAAVTFDIYLSGDEWVWVAGGTTGADGVGEVNLPAGTYRFFVSSQKHYEQYESGPLAIDSENRSITARLTTVAYGVVHIECPVGGECSDHGSAYTELRNADSTWYWYMSLDADGQATFPTVPAGTYRLRVYAHGLYAEYLHPTEISVSAGETTTVTPVYERLPSDFVSFRFSHDDGAPFEGGWIGIYSETNYHWYSENVGSSEFSIELPAGSGTWEAWTNSDGYESASGEFSVEAGSSQTIDVVFESKPVVSVNVTDPSGNPISGLFVSFGQVFEGEFANYQSVWIEENGTASERVSASNTHWRVLPFGLWQGAAGTVTGDSVSIVLQPVLQSGHLTVSLEDERLDSLQLRLSRDDGWVAYLYPDSNNPALLELPVGTYSWETDHQWIVQPQSGTLMISANETTELVLKDFIPNPTFSIKVTDQFNDPVPEVIVNLHGRDNNPAWTSAYLGETGTATAALPLGDYDVYVYAPNRYKTNDDAIHWTFEQEGQVLAIELEELPNGSLTINIQYENGLELSSWVTVQDSVGNYLDSAFVWNQESIVFDQLLYGDDFRITVDRSFWYTEFTSEPFDFNADHGAETIKLEAYDVVTVNVTATSAVAGGILPEPTEIYFSTANSGRSASLEPQENGTLTGTVELPAQSLETYWWETFYESDQLPGVLDLTAAESPYAYNLQITTPPYGYAVFEVAVPAGATLSGTIEIERDGRYYDSVYLNADETRYESSRRLLAGTYSWTYRTTGVLTSPGGQFTVVDGNVTVPVVLGVAHNGIVIVETVFPEGLDNLDRGGWVQLLDENGNYIMGRSMFDLSLVAIGPVRYGVVQVLIEPWDTRLLPAELEVNLNAPTVNVTTSLKAKSELDPHFITVTVTSEDDGEIRDGVVYFDGEEHPLDDGNSVVLNVTGYPNSYIHVSATNYWSAYHWWDAADGDSVEISLGNAVPVIELTFEDEDGAPISNLGVSFSTCYTIFVGETDGTYVFKLDEEDSAECSLVVTEYSGIYATEESYPITITDMLTQETITLDLNENLVENVEIHLEFEDGLPVLDVDAGDRLMVRLIGAGGAITQTAEADAEGKVVFSLVKPGDYQIYVFGFTDSWKYDPATTSADPVRIDQSNQVVQVDIAKFALYAVTVRVETSDGLPINEPVRIGVSGAASIETLTDATGEVVVHIPASGPFGFYALDTAFYSNQGTVLKVAIEEGEIITIPMVRIAPVPLPSEPEPSVTPTESVTATTTATATETATSTATATVTPTETQQPVGQQLIIRLNLSGGQDIAGSPYSLYAPIAAQFMAEPYLRGVVGPNNTIQIDGLIPGRYRLVVEPVGMPPIDAIIIVGNDAVTEVWVTVSANGDVDVSYEQPQPPATEIPGGTQVPGPTTPAGGEQPTATVSAGADAADAAVTGLPSTGAGHSSSIDFPIAAMIAAFALAFIAIPVGLVRDNRR